MVAPVPRGPVAQRPVHLRVHVAKDALGKGQKVRPVRPRARAQLPRAVPAVRARDQVGKGGRAGAPREAAVAPPAVPAHAVVLGALGAPGRVGVVPEFDRLGLLHAGALAGRRPFVPGGVGAEEHGGPGAVGAGVVVVVGGEVGEVLHVDLQGGGGDAVAVVVVDPGACWLASELAMRRL